MRSKELPNFASNILLGFFLSSLNKLLSFFSFYLRATEENDIILK